VTVLILFTSVTRNWITVYTGKKERLKQLQHLNKKQLQLHKLFTRL